jgi:hypothetical protein
MKTTFEDDLSAALSARADTLPAGAADRLAAIDYHPRRRGRAAPTALGVTAVGAATAGTALAVVFGGAAPAYAGWSATPTAAPSATPSTQASQSCLNSLPADQPGGSGQLGSGSWQTLLTDVRGPFTVALFQNDGAYAGCFTSSSFTEVTQVTANGSSAANAQSVNGVIHTSGSGGPPGGLPTVTVGGTSSGDLQNVVQAHLSTTADGPYTLVDGRVASGVTGVTLVLDNGQDVVATVADGWLLAWWPGDAAATSSQVTNASGTTSEPLTAAAKGPPPSGPGSPPCTPSSVPASTQSVVHCTGSGGAQVATNSGNSGANS